MNDAAYVDYGPQITPVTYSPLWSPAPAGMEQYWGWNDPRWGSWGETPERMQYRGPWEQVLKSMGFQGSKPDAETAKRVTDPSGIYKFYGDEETGQLDLSPDAKAFIDRLRAAGYDLRQKHPDRRTFNTYYGLVTPSGEVQDIKIRGSDLGDAIMPMIKVFGAGLGLAGLGAGLNALAGGGAGAGANALAGAGIGGLEGAAFADLAAGMLPEFGTSAAYSAGLTGGAGLGGGLALTDISTSGLGDVLAGGADATGAGGVVETGGAVVDAGTAGLNSAERAALLGNQGYGAGMTGAQTGVYDTVLGATGSKGVADLAANLAGGAGTAGSYLDKAINFVASPAGSALVSGASNIVSGVLGANAAESAAQTQSDAANRAIALQEKMYQDYLDMTKDYREAGVNALGKLTRGEILPEPGYAFRLGEGMKALERVQAARGNMLSGGALKAGQRYAQDLASQEYGNAYNRLANIAGLGQTATTQAGTAGQNYASQAGELGLQQANALAQGRIGRQTSYTNALMGAAGALQDYVQAPMKEQMFRDIYGRLMGKP